MFEKLDCVSWRSDDYLSQVQVAVVFYTSRCRMAVSQSSTYFASQSSGPQHTWQPRSQEILPKLPGFLLSVIDSCDLWNTEGR